MLQRTPMKRGNGFKRPELVRAPRGRLTKAQGGVQAMISDLVLANPKGEKAKPGKRAPTVAERVWMEFIVVYGCIACRLEGQQPRPTAVHHILRGGVRMGHLHTLPLCDPGHHQGGQQLGMISRHPDKARFEAAYGTEQQLLEQMRKVYAAQTERASVAMKVIAP